MSLTLTVKVQVGPADEVHVTVVVPTGKNDPDAGEQLIVPQVPLDVGAGYVTTAPHWFGSFAWVTLAGQVMLEQVPPVAPLQVETIRW